MKTLIICLGLLMSTLSAQIILAVDSPISQLPASISAPAGRLSLIADFHSAKPGESIKVYLVNNSDSDLQLQAQNGDVYLKLETMDKKKHWQRAQPHSYSWCGNSYDVSPVVRKGHFMEIKGYQPLEGRKAKVRFRLYGQKGMDLVTQVGDGLVLDSDITKAASDAMTVSSGSFEFVASVARGEKKIDNTSDHISDLQDYAIHLLGSDRFPSEKVLPLLEEISQKFPEYKDAINDARSQVEGRKK